MILIIIFLVFVEILIVKSMLSANYTDEISKEKKQIAIMYSNGISEEKKMEMYFSELEIVKKKKERVKSQK